ncbi:hypothetical protein LAZ67_2006099 [Cordylochernes scorpioides]|uniref:Uncharacterized protein n=1 Tax=Cordylochernes scorpioides TaxID=51811 RepID=A0ABY6K7W9_9ARAC|nr:hypothetical protein LAZ67_2006095 [Cordylochernes scorpioides]UYV63945.1 hypothetical protein LAZ67_2006099 [Cordylochernes scorpioides]
MTDFLRPGLLPFLSHPPGLLYNKIMPGHTRHVRTHLGSDGKTIATIKLESWLISVPLKAPYIMAAERDFQWQGIRSGSKDVSQGWRKRRDGREQRLGAGRGRSLGWGGNPVEEDSEGGGRWSRALDFKI